MPKKRARISVKCEPCEQFELSTAANFGEKSEESTKSKPRTEKGLKSMLMKINGVASARTRRTAFTQSSMFEQPSTFAHSFSMFEQPSTFAHSSSYGKPPPPLTLPAEITLTPICKNQERKILAKPYTPSMPDYTQKDMEAAPYSPTDPPLLSPSVREPECIIENCSWGQHLSQQSPASPPPFTPSMRPININQLMPPPLMPPPRMPPPLMPLPSRPPPHMPPPAEVDIERFGWASPSVIHESMAAQIFTTNIALNLRIKAQDAKIRALEQMLSLKRAGRPRKC